MKTEVLTYDPPKEESRALKFLYGNVAGRIILRILRAKWLSKAVGAFLDSRLSKFLIRPFVRKNNINLDEYESDNFTCFNDCFCRKIKPGLRETDLSENALVAPCDGLLSVYKAERGAVYPVKQSRYTLSSLLKNERLASEFENGYIYVFRLCVNHYHRYSYAASGKKGGNVHINGTLHTVRPIALESTAVFCENSREYTVIDTDNFGRIVQMEVGAMLVGKIKNLHGEKTVLKGEEKGMFLYGGSTVILLTGDGVSPLPVLLENTARGIETPVTLGENVLDLL